MSQRRKETHAEALRAAARLAFSAAVIGGCIPQPAVTQAPVTSQPPAQPAPEAVPTATAEPPPPPNPQPRAIACDELRRQVFPDQFSNIDPNTAPAGLIACCESRVFEHGYDVPCCNYLFQSGVLDPGSIAGDPRQQQVLRGCSPWGPPMPPAATARREQHPRRIARRRARALSLRSGARRNAPTVPTLPHLRDVAIATWRARMVNEHGSARVFEGLSRRLERAGLPGHDEAVRFAADERRHGVLCGAVVEALGGEARADAGAREPYPSHRDAASAVEAALRDVLSICCLSETVAVALIGAERLEMPAGPLRDLLTRIYADEVAHARFGWRLLETHAPALDARTKQALSAYLAVAFAHLEEHELAHLPAEFEPPPEGREYGLCTGRDARALFYDAIAEVIVPGLEQHGIPARRAWLERSLSGAHAKS